MDIPNWLTLIGIVLATVGNFIVFTRKQASADATFKANIESLRSDLNQVKQDRKADLAEMKNMQKTMQDTLHHIELLLAAKYGVDYFRKDH